MVPGNPGTPATWLMGMAKPDHPGAQGGAATQTFSAASQGRRRPRLWVGSSTDELGPPLTLPARADPHQDGSTKNWPARCGQRSPPLGEDHRIHMVTLTNSPTPAPGAFPAGPHAQRALPCTAGLLKHTPKTLPSSENSQKVRGPPRFREFSHQTRWRLLRHSG